MAYRDLEDGPEESGLKDASPAPAPVAVAAEAGANFPTTCYLLANYISHRKAGMALKECLRTLGVPLTEDPERADTVILHNEPWSYAGYYRAIPALKRKHVIAYAVWETDILPERYRFNLGLVDEVWTCSRYCRAALLPAGRKVSLIPHIVVPPEADEQALRRVRERISYDDGLFYFYTIVGGPNPRKNMPAALKAFAQAFPGGGEKVRFVVKSSSPIPPDLAAIPGIIAVSDHFADREIDALHHLCHCFVSPHRAEGWGLGIAEAMAAGNLVVATGFSGNMDFMHAENSLALAYRLEAIRQEEVWLQPHLLSPAMSWAYVDEQDLREALRHSFHARDQLAPLGRQASVDMRRFAPEQVAPLLKDCLLASR